jgi:hypothetical protein
MNIISLVIYLIVAIFVAIFINKKFVSKFEESMKKVVFVISFIVCIVVALGEFVVTSIKNWVFDIVNLETIIIEKIIIEQNQENILAKEGIDISFIDEAIIEVKNMVPKTIHGEYGLLQNVINESYNKIISIAFYRIENKKWLIAKYSKNNIITLSSILITLKNDILSYLNWKYLRWHLYILGVLLIYIGYCIYTGYESKKYYKSSVLFGEGAKDIEKGMSGKEK